MMDALSMATLPSATRRARAAAAGQAGGKTPMATDRNDKVPTSSIVMKAIDAKTFTELQAFGKDLESRPTERLLRDVADLVRLSESKAQIVSSTIATKFRHADAEGRQRIRESLEATLEKLSAGEERNRVSSILERVRGMSK
jgi:hypothetical protein